MAINRFMKPWKRDLTTDYYTPNFEAWAKLLDKKDTDMEETLAGADKLSSLIPEAGLRLRDDRNAYMQEINAQKEAITNALYESGNTSEARRRIRGLSSDILSSPRLPMYNIDKTFMPEAMKLTMSQTSKSDIYGTPEDEWYDPQTGQVKQTTYDKYDPASAYAYTKTQDTHTYFNKMGANIKPFFEQFKHFGDELVAKSYTDEETGETKTKYYLEGKEGTREFIDVKHLMKFLDPDGKYGDLAKELYKNAQGDERAYWDAKHRNLSEEERETKFYEDLLASNLDRIYDKTTNETFLQSAGGVSKKDSEGSGDTQINVLQSTFSLGQKYDKIINTPTELLSNKKRVDKALKDIESEPKYLEAQARVKNLLQIKDGDQVFVRDGSKFRINEHYLSNLTPEQAAGLYDTRLDDYASINDYLSSLSDSALSLTQEQERYDELLTTLKLNDSKSQIKIEEARKKAEEDYKRDRTKFLSLKKEQNRAKEKQKRNLPLTQYEKELLEKNLDVAGPNAKDYMFEQTMRNLENDPVMSEKLRIAGEVLKNATSKTFVKDVNTYYLFGTDNKSQTAMKGISSAVDMVIRDRAVEIKNPYTEEVLEGDQRDAVLKAMNDFIGLAKRDDYSYEFKNDFQVFFDPEEARYKLLVTLRNSQNVADELNIPSPTIEVPLSVAGTSTTINGINIEEYLGIEGNPSVTNDLNVLAGAFNTKGAGTATLEAPQSENIYSVSHDVLKMSNQNESPTTLRIKNPNGGNWRFNTRDPREAVAIKDLIDGETGFSKMPKSVENINLVMEEIRRAKSKSLPSLTKLNDEDLKNFVETFIGTSISEYSNNDSTEFYEVKTEQPIQLSKSLDRSLKDLAARFYSATGVKAVITDGYSPDRKNEKSLHISGDAFDVRYSDTMRQFFESHLEQTIVPRKEPYYLGSKFGGLKFIYEGDATHGENKDYTGPHFHFYK